MKKNIFYSLAALFCMAAALVSCSSDGEILNPAETETPAKTRTITVNLIPKAETRTYLDEDAKLKWTPGDEVSYWLYNSSTNEWETSRKATIDADGRLQVTVGENETKIRVGYPAVEDGTAYDASLFEVKKLQTMDDDDLLGIISNVFHEDENATFLLGKYLPMETSDIDITQETTVINAPYTVKGAVVKFKLTLPEGVYDYPCIKSVSAGEYKFEFLSTGFETEGLPFTDQEYKQGEFCVVVPVGEGIDYTPSVEVVDYKIAGWDYNFDGRYIYTRNETKTSTFTAKAYELNLNLGDAEKYDCQDLGKITFDDETKLTGTLNGHAWVDLGIRKSDYDQNIAAGSKDDRRVIFATTNIGAATPQDYGYYFHWGEQQGWAVLDGRYISGATDNEFIISSAKQYDKDGAVLNTADENIHASMDGAWPIHYNGIADFQGQTNLEYNGQAYGDAATYNWGEKWKMIDGALLMLLTAGDSDRAIPSTFTIGTASLSLAWTTINEVKCLEISNTASGLSIALPLAGRLSSNKRTYDGQLGQYWTTTPWGDDGYFLNVSTIKNKLGWSGAKSQRQPVRPIAELPL